MSSDFIPTDDEASNFSSITFTTLIAKKFVTGYFGGIASSVCSHPFDLIKSRVQSGQFPDVRTTIRETYRREGAAAFYKGVTAPISVAGLFSAVLFTSNEIALKSLVWAFPPPPRTPSNRFEKEMNNKFSHADLPISYLAIAGALSSPTASLVLTPADVIKIQLQLQKEDKGERAKYKGMIDCGCQLWRAEGMQSLMRGYVPTVGSRAVGFPAFFVGHEYGKRWWKEKIPNSSDLVTELFAGSCSGVLLQIVYQPFELVKTKVQGQTRQEHHGSEMIKSIKKTPMEISIEIFRTKGIKGFYFGFWVSMLRAIPANATVFAGVDVGGKLWNQI